MFINITVLLLSLVLTNTPSIISLLYQDLYIRRYYYTVDYKQLTRRVNMVAVIMVDSGSRGTTVAMTQGTGSNEGLYHHTYS